MLQVSVSPREDRASTRARVPGTLGISLLSRPGLSAHPCRRALGFTLEDVAGLLQRK